MLNCILLNISYIKQNIYFGAVKKKKDNPPGLLYQPENLDKGSVAF